MRPLVGSFRISYSKSRGRRPALQILLCCFRQFAVVVLALGAAPFGIPVTTFWIYVCASLLFIIGFIKILNELPQEHGVDKIMPFGRLFFAIPMAVFGSEHFTATADIATLVPRWIPAHTFWVYLVGLAFLCAALSIAVLVQARLAAALVGMTMFIFVCVMDMPAIVAHPRNSFFGPLLMDTREHQFLFGPEIADFIDQVYGKGVDLHTHLTVNPPQAVQAAEVLKWFAIKCLKVEKDSRHTWTSRIHEKIESLANFLLPLCEIESLHVWFLLRFTVHAQYHILRLKISIFVLDKAHKRDYTSAP
jgi:hypothetical protein